MIQRIQTLYLLIVVILTGLTLWLPLAGFSNDGGTYLLTAFGVRDAAGNIVQSTVYLGILLVLTAVLPLVVIFLFKRRMLQFRLCVAELMLLIGSIGMMGIYFFLCRRFFSGGEFYGQELKVALIFPVVCLVFDFLAARAILKDEKLVRSLDRIR